MPRRLVFVVLGAAAGSSTAALAASLVLDAMALSAAPGSLHRLAIAATSLDVVSLGCVASLSVWRARKSIRRHWVLGAMVPSLAALTTSAIFLALARTSPQAASARLHSSLRSWLHQSVLQFVFWALALAAQVALFCAALSRDESTSGLRLSSAQAPRDSFMSEVEDIDIHPPTTLEDPGSPAALGLRPLSALSARSSQSLRSWRDSFQASVRPVTSRSKLVRQHSFSRESRNASLDVQSVDSGTQPDGFDMWDTSQVDASSRDAVLQTAPSRGTALEPIPGSRPSSPARALEGPFASDGESSQLPSPPKMYLDPSRPPSPCVKEAHIHPLFRSESPTPPPVATLGTNIAASPLSSQAISCPPRSYQRMRSGSRAASPSLPRHSPGLSEHSLQSRPASRSPSPESREMTPPIPDFVLTSSPRSSMYGAQMRRKISLQPETAVGEDHG